MPTVSVIVPCYNQAIYLPETLRSVSEQTYTDWECIVVNDGSPDNTEAVAKEWAQKDGRFKYVYKTNGGLSSARNTGIQNAEGKYMLPLDSDDLLDPTFLEKGIRILESAEADIVSAQVERFGSETGIWAAEIKDLRDFLFANQIIANTLFKKEVWQTVGGFDETMREGFEDWDFWLSAIEKGYRFQVIAQPLLKYRIKEVSMVTETSKVQDRLLHVLYQKHTGLYHAHQEYVYHTLQELARGYRTRIKKLENDKAEILASRTYTTGHRLLAPFRQLFGFSKKIRS